jgi:hypothetical protein
VDDWAHRRGRAYGAILVDLERHAVLDLLPDRGADSLAAWLQDHPGVAVVSRDRWEAFADGARRGAPMAGHVLDRFHLVKNLGGTLESLFRRRHAVLDEAAALLRERAAGAAGDEGPEVAAEDAPATGRAEQADRRARRLHRYEEVLRRHALGWTHTAIAASLPIDRKTIRRWLRAGAFPERRPPARRRGVLGPHEGYLRRRWADGCQVASVLHRELQERGYRGSVSRLRHYLSGWRRSPSGRRAGRNPYTRSARARRGRRPGSCCAARRS